MFLIGTGGSLNPTAWPEQLERRTNPSILLIMDDDALISLESEFIFFKRNLEDGIIEPCFSSDTTIFHDIYCFVSGKVSYRKDSSIYYALDHLATPSEVLYKGADDCDGKAVVICTMLLKRGYDAYVVMGTEHTWVEVADGENYVYIARLDCNDPVVITTEPLPRVGSTYVRFNRSENDWSPLPLFLQGLVVFAYIFLLLMAIQSIYAHRLHVRPVGYISEIFGYFRYILYMFLVIFFVWVMILLLIKYLSTLQ